MYGTLKDQLTDDLAALQAEGLFKAEAVIRTPQSARIAVDDQTLINFCANNYLGLADHPALIAAAKEAMDSHGLGMAPLAGLEDRPLAPLWNRLAGQVFRHGEHFYNFQGLRQFKEKFDPEWEPKYLASSSGLALPRILANILSLTSRGLKGTIAK